MIIPVSFPIVPGGVATNYVFLPFGVFRDPGAPVTAFPGGGFVEKVVCDQERADPSQAFTLSVYHNITAAGAPNRSPGLAFYELTIPTPSALEANGTHPYGRNFGLAYPEEALVARTTFSGTDAATIGPASPVELPVGRQLSGGVVVMLQVANLVVSTDLRVNVYMEPEVPGYMRLKQLTAPYLVH